MTKAIYECCQKDMKNSRKIIILNICLAALFAVIAATLAAYTSLTSVKRVVSTQGTRQLFSSNLLTEYTQGQEIAGRTLSFASDGNENSFVVTVCNFAQGDKTKWVNSNLDYELTVTLMDVKTGEAVSDAMILNSYKVNNISLDVQSIFQGNLTGDEATEDSYMITVPTAHMKDYQIKITASRNQDHPLGRIFSIVEYTANAAWKLSFLNIEQAQEAYELGAINTVLSGQEHANFTLKWDINRVNIDPWFLKDMGLNQPEADADGWCSLSFEVGGIEQDGNARPNKYHVAFYRTAASNANDTLVESWDDIQKSIQYSSTPIVEVQ